MAAIEVDCPDSIVIGRCDAVEIWGQVRVGVIGAIAPAAANIACSQIPACPNRLAQVVAVINRLNRALNQVMVVIVRVGCGTTGIAELHLQGRVNRREGRRARKPKQDSKSDTEAFHLKIIQPRAVAVTRRLV